MPKVHRYISYFDKRTERLIGEQDLRGVPLRALRRLFRVPPTDPMYASFPITPDQAKALQKFTPKPLNPARYDYFLECEA